MATITGLTAQRMQQIIDKTIVGASIAGTHLILTLSDGSTMDAGVAVGPPGSSGVAPQDLQDAPGRAFQEGVEPSAPALPVVYQSGTLIRVMAGSAWINGDGVSGVGSGRYRVSWPQTDLTVPASPSSRLDQVIIRLASGGWGVAPTVELLQGISTTGVTLDNRSQAAALPNGCFRLADVLLSPNVANQAAIRDRRTWARGARTRITRFANGSSGNDYTTTTPGSFGVIDSTNLAPRIELSGVPLKIRLSMAASCLSNNGCALKMTMDGVTTAVGDEGTLILYSPDDMASSVARAQSNSGRRIFEWHLAAPAAGSHTVIPYYAGDGANPMVIAARAGVPLIMTIEEELRVSQANG